MEHNEVTRYLTDFRSYEYATFNCGGNPDYERLPLVVSERIRNPNAWDRRRYSRIVNIIKGAVDSVLSDDQRTVICRKYLDRNRMTLEEIAVILHKDRSTISRWHTESLRRLAIALEPLKQEESELDNFDFMFNRKGQFKTEFSKPLESA